MMLIAKTVTLVGTLGAFALAAPSTTGDPQVTMHFRAVTTHERVLDLGDRGKSLGDEDVAGGRLVGAGGTTIGTFGAVCTVVGAGASRCDGFGALADGQLTFTGLSRDGTAVQAAAITGGTGSYKTARGELELRDVGPHLTAVMVTLAEG